MKSVEIPYDPVEIRKKAENLQRKKHYGTVNRIIESDKKKLIHELEVHQIELELQNEELNLARSEALDSARKYTELYDFAPIGYITLSAKGSIVDLNLQGACMLGKGRSQLINSLFGLFVSGDTLPQFNLLFDKVFKSRIKETCEIKLSTTGRDFPVYVFLTGIVTGNKSQCLVTLEDVTERRQAEKSRIENQRLNAVGEMASSIAHDFNNALQSILGNLELCLLNPERSDNTVRYLETIRSMIHDIAGRVKLLQRFGEKQESKQRFEYHDLNDLIEEVIIQLRPIWKNEKEKDGTKITFKPEYGDIPKVYGYDGELRIVLHNLFRNSIEAIQGVGEIRVKSACNDKNIHLIVQDTGIGMDESTRGRIFQPYFTTKGLESGRGLGMTGVLSIVKDHGGVVYVKETSPGKGTTMEVIFPVHGDQLTGFKKESKTEKQLPDPAIRILWVDDDPGINKLVVEMFKFLGYQGDTVNNAKSALELLERKTYDLVITDIGMPEMNGWQLADIIRDRFNGNMTVAVISGWDQPPDKQVTAEHGVSYYLTKPISISTFRQLVLDVSKSLNLRRSSF